MYQDVSTFSADELFGERKKRRSIETVHRSFLRVYSLSPLEYLVKCEERGVLREHALTLKRFLYSNLGCVEVGFISRALGEDWERTLRLPLEFRDFDRRGFEKHLAQRYREIKEKISILVEYCGAATFHNQKDALQEFIGVPFNLATEDQIVKVYEQVRTGARSRYPAGFFHQDNQRVPRILTRYLVDWALELPHTEQAIASLTPQTFSEYHLLWMLEQYFAGNTKRALQHAYTPREFPAAHATKQEPDDILREVFLRLDRREKVKR